MCSFANLIDFHVIVELVSSGPFILQDNLKYPIWHRITNILNKVIIDPIPFADDSGA